MRIIHSRSPNQALHEGLYHLHFNGKEQDSRAGPVIVSRDPVMTVHHDPSARVLVGATRDANPFFHLFEALWMLAGRNDVQFPQTFVGKFGMYSDDGVTLNGAYGFRWRQHFGYDQLGVLTEQLTHDPKTRRAVLQMWDASMEDMKADIVFGDLERGARGSKDVPCNTAAYFDTVDDRLNMTVTCRSNDVIWGAYGANVVHFSILLEYIALRTGLEMGVYRQFSNNYHIYASLLQREQFCGYADSVLTEDIYQMPSHEGIRGRLIARSPAPARIPLLNIAESWDAWEGDLNGFMREVDAYNKDPDQMTIWMDPASPYPKTRFFRDVVKPMFFAWKRWKAKDYAGALELCEIIRATDWRAAATDFIYRRKEKAGA